MKKFLLLSGIFLIISCKKNNDKKLSDKSTLSDSIHLKTVKGSSPAEDDLSYVEGVKKEYNLLNSKLTAKKLDSLNFNYECEERSGNVVYYSENGTLKVIRHFTADSHFSSSESYFIHNGQPFFIFKEEAVWSFNGGTPEKPETKDDVTQQRIYLSGKNVIQCLEKKFILKSDSSVNPDPEKIPNEENKNCSAKEVTETFALLLKNKNKKGSIKCL
nr:hypothetical protein [uncultured Chryseobacterium sp.]